MIDVLKRLAELDDKNPNVYKDTEILNKKEISQETVKESQDLDVTGLKYLAGLKEVLDECGMMPGSSTPASINITAGSGEELSHMLQDIMSLAGVHKVTPDHMPADTDVDSMKRMLDTMNEPADEGLLGTMAGAGLGAAVAGPLGAAVGGAAGDAITGDKEEEEQEEGYTNSPDDPRDVPALDSNKFAYDPNDGDHKERQAGLARAVPMETVEQQLYREYQEFIAEGKKAKCNHTPKGKECPVHGLKECGSYQ